MGNQRILHLKDGSFEASVVKRNALNRILDMRLKDAFERVVIVFFKAPSDKKHLINNWLTVYDCQCFPPFFFRAGLKFIDFLLAECIFILRLYFFIKHERITVITADSPHIVGLNAIFISRLTGIPFVQYTVVDYDLFYEASKRRNMPGIPRWLEKHAERCVFNGAQRVIADREYYLKYAIKNAAHPSRCYRVRTTSDHFYFSAVPRHNFHNNDEMSGKKIIFYFGRLHQEKLPDHLLYSLEIIKESRPDVLLLIAGNGPMRAELEDMVKRLRLKEMVKFLGVLSNQQLVDVMAVADALVATHAGYALIEMALSGKPVIAYDYEWHPELIKHKQTGLLVPYKDYRKLAQTILYVFTHSDEVNSYGRAARKAALENHHPDDAAEDERRIYYDLFSRRNH